MATESPLRLIGSSGSRNWPTGRNAASHTSSASNVAAQELGMLLQGHGVHGSRELAGLTRSGSAPPSMEGSSLAIADLKQQLNSSLEEIFQNLTNAAESSESEEQLRSDPAYLAYYYANVNLNPRLPRPIVSRHNRRLVQHIGDRRMMSFDDSNKGSSFVSRPSLSTHEEEPEDDRSPRVDSDSKEETSSAFVSGQYSSSLRGRHKSLVDLIQEDFPRTPSPVYNNQSHPSIHGSSELVDPDALNLVQDSPISMTKAESKTATVGVSTSPIPLAISSGQKGELNTLNSSVDKGIFSCNMAGSSIGNIQNETLNLRISNDVHRSQVARQHSQKSSSHPRSASFQVQTSQSLATNQGMPHPRNSMDHFPHGQPKLSPSVTQPASVSTGIAPALYASASTAAYGAPNYTNLQPSSLFPQFTLGGYPFNTPLVAPVMTGYSPYNTIPIPLGNPASTNLGARTSSVPTDGNATPIADMQNLFKFYGQFGVETQPSLMDPMYMSYFQHPSVDANANIGQYDSVASRGSNLGSPLGNFYLRPQALRAESINVSDHQKGGTASPNYSGSPQNFAMFMPYPTSPLGSPVYQVSPVAGASPFGRRNENVRSPFNSPRTGGAYTGWQGRHGRENIDDQKPLSFLEEMKSSKSRRYELSDIAERVVEFSADQHGSRFIQQKLETCTVEEKASVFQEVLPYASTLMTDVFGNYVIQKFFEYGSPEQRKEIANKVVGHVLPLSLQMYGCRVIQKALEVIELDQKTKLVHELDGHVMHCVHDQNGNHVIQKCIECLPTEKIDFIISAFRGNVSSLSMHPYGCRVIQRVLEHCTDELQSQRVVDEILQSACILAQNQYGNYVIQHVLKSGKPLDRSQIIKKLAGQVVQMSQHKFASNVIEKCLEHGSPVERDLLIEEIIGQTEGNDSLVVMMKDQFANYVVQKILETCSDRQRQILLSRIRVHLQALKKYTYGKHIVARVEQLCGEEFDDAESRCLDSLHMELAQPPPTFEEL